MDNDNFKYLWLAFGECFDDRAYEDTLFETNIQKQKKVGITKWQYYFQLYCIIYRAYAFHSLGVYVTSGMSLQYGGYSEKYVNALYNKWKNPLRIIHLINPAWLLAYMTSISYMASFNAKAKAILFNT